MNVKVIGYDAHKKKKSISCKAIARFQRGKNRIKPDGKFRGTVDDLIVNWGYAGRIDDAVIGNSRLLNTPHAINLASNKVSCLRTLEDAGVPTLDFYTSREELEEVILDENEFDEKIYCRTLTRSHSGRGIVIAQSRDEIVDAELYTIEFRNDREYRVHVFNGEIIDIQQKRRMSSERREKLSISEIKNDVRNLMNGWSFTRNNIEFRNNDDEYIEDLFNVPIDAVEALGLDFGAVDLLYDSETDQAIVCEVNTAAGQKVGTTTNYRYIKAIHEYAGNDINLEIYNRRWNSELTEFNNGMVEFLNNFR